MKAIVGDGVRWVGCDPMDEDTIQTELRDADICVSPRLTPSMIADGSRLKLVHATGAGVEQISMELAPNALLANTYNHGRSTAEYVLLCMMAHSRELLKSDRLLRQGVWYSSLKDPSVPLATTLRGKTLGIVGFGEIGRELCTLAQAMGLSVAAIKRSPDPELAARMGLSWLGTMSDTARLLKESDFITIAVPLDDSTLNLVSTEQFALMRPSAFLVNVARGGIVNEAALFDALATSTISGAAIDVWWQYPVGAEGRPSALPFESLDNVIMTPHTSSLTAETMDRRARDIALNIDRFRNGQPLENLVVGGN